MSRAKTRDINKALDLVGATSRPTSPLSAALTQEAVAAGDTEPTTRKRRRGRRVERIGIVIYVDSDTHHTLKHLALDQRCSLQDLCTSAVMKLIG